MAKGVSLSDQEKRLKALREGVSGAYKEAVKSTPKKLGAEAYPQKKKK